MAGPAIAEGQFGDPVEAVVIGPVIADPPPNKSSVTFRTVTVATAGTPQQGPTVTVPDGFALLIRLRITQGAVEGRVSDSSANALDAAKRMEMVIGDSISLKVNNMNLLFFDADTNGTVFELVAEQ